MGSPELASEFQKFIIDGAAPKGQAGLDLNEASRFDSVLQSLRDFQISPGKVTCRFTVTKLMQNRLQTLHGGWIATMVDVVSTIALVSVSQRSGVSLNINTDYLSPIPCGEEGRLEARVVKVGQTVATLSVDVWRVKTGQLAAQGKHIKFLPDTVNSRRRMQQTPQSKL